MLKKLLQLNFLLVFLIASGFTTETPEKLIVKKWKLDAETSKKNALDSFVPSDNAENDKMAKGMLEYMIEVVSQTVTEYKADGKVINTSKSKKADGTEGTKVTTGSWKFSTDKKQLLVTEDGKQTALKIVSLTADKMELEFNGMGGSSKKGLVFVFLPVK